MEGVAATTPYLRDKFGIIEVSNLTFVHFIGVCKTEVVTTVSRVFPEL